MEVIFMRRNDEDWLKLFDDQKNSGLSISKFCEMNNIVLASFYNAKCRLTNKKIECIRLKKTITNNTNHLSFILNVSVKESLITNLVEAVKKVLDSSSLNKEIETLTNELNDMNKEF